MLLLYICGTPYFSKAIESSWGKGLRWNFGKWCRVHDIGRGFTNEIGNILLIVD
jgi:hypothetical protein